jgi:hypothetical protein
MKPLTAAEEAFEHEVTYTTRLNILCPEGTPTPEQKQLAQTEANEHIRALRQSGALYAASLRAKSDVTRSMAK